MFSKVLFVFIFAIYTLGSQPFILNTYYPGKLNVNYTLSDQYFIYAPRFGVESGVFVFDDGNNQWSLQSSASIDRLIDVETIGDHVFLLTTTECMVRNLKTGEDEKNLSFNPSSSSSMLTASANVLAVSSEHIIMTYEYKVGYWLRSYGGPPAGPNEEFADYTKVVDMAIDDETLLVCVNNDQPEHPVVMSYVKENGKWKFGGRVFFMTDEDYFGYRLAVDSKRCAIYSSVPDKPEMGGITTFVYESGEWNIEELITPPDSWFFPGMNVSLDIHEDFMAIGTYDDDGSNGKVYVYKYSNESGWSVISTLRPDNISAKSFYGQTLRFSPSGILSVESPGTDEMYFYDDYVTGPSTEVTETAEQTLSVSCFPNVSSGHVVFESNRSGTLEIINLVGKKVFSTELKPGKNPTNLELTPGLYLYNMSGEKISGKLIIK